MPRNGFGVTLVTSSKAVIRVGVLVSVAVLIASACQSSAVNQAPTDNASIAAHTDATAPASPAPADTRGQPSTVTSSAPSSPTAATTQRATALTAATRTRGNGAAASPVESAVSPQSRVELLKMADTAYASRDPARAQALYGRVISSSADPSESIAQTRALTGFAEFRLLLTVLSVGNEDTARQLLERLRSGTAESPFTRLANDFWDQYGMTASVQGACSAIARQVGEQADESLAVLRAMSVSIGTRQLCVAPGN